MQISEESWKKYVDTLAAINKKAGRLMQVYIDKNGYEDRKKLIERAYQISSIYGEANGSLACQMYDEIARLQGAHVPNAEMADTPNYGEVAKAVQGTMINQNSTVPGTVERLTKQVGADTMLKNAKRDGAEWAWIPGGSETCAFCIALASQGWMPASRAQVHGSHASHIHANCKCEFAIRFDKKSNVEGYDPDHYYDMYINASSSKDSKKKINALRRELVQMRQINLDKKQKLNFKRYDKEIECYKALNGKYDIYVSKSSKIKEIGLNHIEKAIDFAIKKLEIKDTINLPQMIILTKNEMDGAFASYNAVKNRLLVSEEIGNRNKTTERQKEAGFACPKNPNSTIVHEFIHFKDAQKYIKKNGKRITSENYNNYIDLLNKKAKMELDKKSIGEKYLLKISTYASKSYLIKKFDESFTELRVVEALRNDNYEL